MRVVEVTGDMVSAELPPDVAAAFDQLGELQRGEPELIMLRVQRAMGGGVLSPAVEHVGDIIHRMTRQGGLMNWGLGAAAEKIDKTYRWLTHGYGFARELEENIQVNAQENNLLPEDLRHQIDQALAAYAKAHAKLPVYNVAQFLARQASISLGEKQWNMAAECLSTLKEWASDPERWKAKALEYRKDPTGKLLQYPYSRGSTG